MPTKFASASACGCKVRAAMESDPMHVGCIKRSVDAPIERWSDAQTVQYACRYCTLRFSSSLPLPLQQLLQLGLESRCEVITGERVGDVRGQEADLGAAIVDRAIEPDSEERSDRAAADN